MKIKKHIMENSAQMTVLDIVLKATRVLEFNKTSCA